MNTQRLTLTKQEREFIECIRTLKKTRHNYSFQFELYVRELFELLLLDY